MKNSLYLFLLISFSVILCSSINSETKNYDAVYYLVDKEIAEMKDYDYTIIDTLSDGIYHYREYTKDSVICYDYYRMSDTVDIGEFKKYYSNSKINKSINYNKKGQLHGESKTFYVNGNKKRIDNFTNGKLDSGSCWDINGNIIKYFNYDIEPKVNLEFLSKSLVYPENLRKSNIESSIYIKLLIDSNGTPLKFRYNQYQPKEFIKEIARVIKIPGIFKSALRDSIPIKCWITIPINFRLKD